jgi:hypothetical protein
VAVDFYHRLVVSGLSKELKAFRNSVSHTVRRKPVRGMAAWRERVPISFAAMYARCPRLTRVQPEPPNDPYDLAAWPKVSLGNRREEVRYQFHTRNTEMRDFLVPFTREFPGLELKLVTFCLDDDSIVSYLIRNGTVRHYTLPERRHGWHWEQAKKRFGIAGDAIYEHDEARFFAEEGMLAESLNHWQEAAHGEAAFASRRSWWNRPTVRELEFERELAILQLSQRLADDAEKKRDTNKKRRR